MQVENKDWSVFCDQNMWFQNIMTSSIAVAKNINKTGVFGLGVMYYNSGTEDKTGIDSNGNPIPASVFSSTFSPYAIVINAAYSAVMEENMTFGINMKIPDGYDRRQPVPDAGF